MMARFHLGSNALLGGFLAASTLLFAYLLILSLLGGSVAYAWSQFLAFGYWISALALGFGLQVAFYLQLRRNHQAMGGGAVTATGATSAGAMLSCCAHYLVNMLPFLGISALAAFIGHYQQEIFAFGLLANLVGLVYLGRKLIQNKCLTQ